MADILVSGTPTTANAQIASRAAVWVTASVGYVVYNDASNLRFVKTTDGGQTWSATPVDVFVGGTVIGNVDIWFDNWTVGDTGGKIHCVYMDTLGTDALRYARIDTADDGVEEDNLAIVTGTLTSGVLTISKSRGGNIYVVAEDGDASLSVMYRSDDAGATFDVMTTPTEGAAGDDFRLFPGNETDENDMWLLYNDISADALTLKTYDDSGDSWSEAAITAMVEVARSSASPQFTGAVRHSDGHLIVAVWNSYDLSTSDLECLDINGAASITAKANIVSNSDDCFACSMTIDHNTDDLYAAYLGKSDGSETALSTVMAYYKKSTDDATSWGSETALSVDTADDFRSLWADPGGSASRFYPVWFDDDDNDLFGNYDTSVVFAPAAGLAIPIAAYHYNHHLVSMT